MTFLDAFNLWEKKAFSIEPEFDIDLGLTEEELLSILYLKKTRDRIVDVGLSELSFWQGGHRLGKTLGAITRSCIFDQKFELYMETRVTHSVSAYANLIESLDSSQSEHEAVLNAIVCDEAGTSMSGQDWGQAWSKAISKSLQVAGYLHPCISFCAPLRGQVKSDIRKMANVIFKANRKSKKESFFFIYQSNFNDMVGQSGKFFYPKPIIEINGEIRRLNKLTIPLPPSRILERYAEIEKSRKSPLMKQILNEVKKAEIKNLKSEVDINYYVNMVVGDYKIYASARSNPEHPTVDLTLLEFVLKLPRKYCVTIKALSERKLRENLLKVQDALNSTKEEITRQEEKKRLQRLKGSMQDINFSHLASESIKESLGDEKR